MRVAGPCAGVCACAALLLAGGCARRGNPADGGNLEGYRIVSTLAVGGYAEDLKVYGDLAVIAAGQQGVVLVGVADPASPALLGVGESVYEATGCDYAPTDSLAYMTDGSVGAVVFDARDPMHPVNLTSCQGTRTRDLEVVEQTPGLLHYIFAADGEGGFRVWELRYYPAYDAWFGNGVYQADTQGSARGVCVRDGIAFVAAEQMGLVMFDVTSPGSPAPLGAVDTPGEARAVAASGQYAFVADWRAGVQVVDVSDPMAPEIVATIDTPGVAAGAFRHGDLLYAACHAGGVVVYDVTDPTAPVAAGVIGTPYANAVFATGAYVFIADRDWGLVVAEEE
jgi:hypothetical protein